MIFRTPGESSRVSRGRTGLVAASRSVPDASTRNAAAELAGFADAQAEIIEGWYIDHDAIVDPLVGRMREDLAKQAAGQDVFLSYTKEILKFEDILFDADRAPVTMTVRTRLEVAGRQGIYAEDMTDTVILQKESGVWQVVYAQLNKPTAWQYEKDYNGGVPAPGYK
jgi:hypothetical protein